MEPRTPPAPGPGPNSRKVLVDARVLQGGGAGRGEGTYARGLIGGLLRNGFGDRLLFLTDAGLPPPDLSGVGESPEGTAAASLRFEEVRRRYHGRLASYEDAAVLAADLARIRPGVYHSLRLALPGRSSVPVVVTLHDLIPWALGGRRLLGERIRHLPSRRLLRSADRVIAVSESTASDARRLAGVNPRRLRVIGEGVDPRFRPSAGAEERVRKRWALAPGFLFYVGALDARKSPGDLVVAWETARSEGVACELVVAGDPGPQAPRRLGGATLLGRVTGSELVDLLNAAGCLVFPSRYEGFGLPVLEAMACGCPAVAYSNSSLPEVAGDAAILVPDGDAAALGRQAAGLLRDPAASAAASERGIRHAAAFDWDAVAADVIKVYGELMQ